MNRLRISLTEIHVCILCGEFGTCKEGSLCYDRESAVPIRKQTPKYLHAKCNQAYDASCRMVELAYAVE